MKKSQRPKLTIDKTSTDRWMDGLSLLLLIALVVLPAYYYGSLPDRIPTHFNNAGEADGFGSKSMIWMLPAIGIAMYIMLTFLQRIPHKFNYLQEITMDNAEKQYRGGLAIMRFLKLWCTLIFLYITYGSIQTALGNAEGLGKYFTAFVLITGVVVPVIFAIKSASKK